MSDLEDKPFDAVIGGMGVKVPEECPVCGDFTFAGWNMLHGECNCKCGIPFQLRPTSSQEWSEVPYHKVKEEYIDALQAKYEEDDTTEGFADWLAENPEYEP